MSTDTIVPDTTPIGSLKMLISAVVRMKSGHLHHPAGTRALICATRDGRFSLELIVPGSPLKFWVESRDVEIVEAPDQDWWKLLSESPDA